MSARTILAASVVALVIVGCGGGDDGSDGETTAPAARTATEDGGSGSTRVKLARIGEFDSPTYIAQAPGTDDLYVVEREGRLRIVRSGEVLSDPALDISDQVVAEGEQGLLSVAFPPDFQSSRLLYLYFTGNDQDQYVVEYRARDDGTVDEGSARQLLDMDDFASNHNGGMLLFGPDGHLYIGTGDGGIADDPERNGQDLGSLLAKMLRIDPAPQSTAATNTAAEQRPYSIPRDNPFVGQPGARPEICNYGLRNPWRFSFDRQTQALTIADVGESSQEEIDYVPASRICGNNFGWSAFEGTQRLNEDQSAPSAVPPIFTYGRERGCSITGGYVVRDPELPQLKGHYVYGDYCEPTVRSLIPAIPEARNDRPVGVSVESLVSFGEDSGGRIYAVSLNGPVYRLTAG
jgi:glucose/arabinose dehydrogenase